MAEGDDAPDARERFVGLVGARFCRCSRAGRPVVCVRPDPGERRRPAASRARGPLRRRQAQTRVVIESDRPFRRGWRPPVETPGKSCFSLPGAIAGPSRAPTMIPQAAVLDWSSSGVFSVTLERAPPRARSLPRVVASPTASPCRPRRPARPTAMSWTWPGPTLRRPRPRRPLRRGDGCQRIPEQTRRPCRAREPPPGPLRWRPPRRSARERRLQCGEGPQGDRGRRGTRRTRSRRAGGELKEKDITLATALRVAKAARAGRTVQGGDDA